ncbi:hypothetical protein D3874_12345 [Oleomonas cavernae]|uniref:Uncharacterized protein n=1 Tax=Oleomonas cavernae TaxID=2320859 RepID=A0A418WCJ8_9PROT|nr:hypothetical protein D3874_12345 [Oleomonas cavernae]
MTYPTTLFGRDESDFKRKRSRLLWSAKKARCLGLIGKGSLVSLMGLVELLRPETDLRVVVYRSRFGRRHGVTAGTVGRHLAALDAAGFITRQSTGRAVAVDLGPLYQRIDALFARPEATSEEANSHDQKAQKCAGHTTTKETSFEPSVDPLTGSTPRPPGLNNADRGQPAPLSAVVIATLVPEFSEAGEGTATWSSLCRASRAIGAMVGLSAPTISGLAALHGERGLVAVIAVIASRLRRGAVRRPNAYAAGLLAKGQTARPWASLHAEIGRARGALPTRPSSTVSPPPMVSNVQGPAFFRSAGGGRALLASLAGHL